MKIEITQTAHDDMHDAAVYISETLCNKSAALNLIKETEEKISRLRDEPEMYPLVHDEHLAKLGIHFITIKNYIVFYVIKDNKVTILRFLYGQKAWNELFTF